MFGVRLPLPDFILQSLVTMGPLAYKRTVSLQWPCPPHASGNCISLMTCFSNTSLCKGTSSLIVIMVRETDGNGISGANLHLAR